LLYATSPDSLVIHSPRSSVMGGDGQRDSADEMDVARFLGMLYISLGTDLGAGWLNDYFYTRRGFRALDRRTLVSVKSKTGVVLEKEVAEHKLIVPAHSLGHRQFITLLASSPVQLPREDVRVTPPATKSINVISRDG